MPPHTNTQLLKKSSKQTTTITTVEPLLDDNQNTDKNDESIGALLSSSSSLNLPGSNQTPKSVIRQQARRFSANDHHTLNGGMPQSTGLSSASTNNINTHTGSGGDINSIEMNQFNNRVRHLAFQIIHFFCVSHISFSMFIIILFFLFVSQNL